MKRTIMKTLHSPQRSGMHASRESPFRKQELAVLSRVNHDMRSPLSVIVGVLELLEDTGSGLTDSERRYVNLAMKATDDLLMLADGLRLYAAAERELVMVELTPVDLTAIAVEQLQGVAGAKGIAVDIAGTPRPAGTGLALADAGYLKLALTSLARHLAAHLPEPEHGGRRAFEVTVRTDERGSILLQTTPGGNASEAERRPDPSTDDDVFAHDDIGVLNALRLIELMGGRASVGPQAAWMVIELPQARSDDESAGASGRRT